MLFKKWSPDALKSESNKYITARIEIRHRVWSSYTVAVFFTHFAVIFCSPAESTCFTHFAHLLRAGSRACGRRCPCRCCPLRWIFWFGWTGGGIRGKSMLRREQQLRKRQESSVARLHNPPKKRCQR